MTEEFFICIGLTILCFSLAVLIFFFIRSEVRKG